MGNICAGKHDKQQTTQTHDNLNRNFTISEYVLKKYAIIDLIVGTYRCHKSDTLLALVQKQYLDYCTEMRDYADNVEQTMLQIMNQKKSLMTVALNKGCPYKKLQICILPTYSSLQMQSSAYLQQFQNIVREVLTNSNDITIQLTHTTQNANGLPNQTLIAIFMKVLSEKIDEIESKQVRQSNKKGYKISVIANDGKLLNLVRFEIIKLDDFEIRRVPAIQNDSGKNFYC